MPGGPPSPSLGTTWGAGARGPGAEGMVIPLPLHSLEGSGAVGGWCLWVVGTEAEESKGVLGKAGRWGLSLAAGGG